MRDTVVIAIRSDPGDARLFCLPLVLGLAIQAERAFVVGLIVRRSMSASGRKPPERPHLAVIRRQVVATIAFFSS